MMIQELFCALKDSLMMAGIFHQGYEYVELINRKTQEGAVARRPMYYEGGGYKDVQNFDNGGMFYIRKNGSTSLAQDTKTRQATPCNPGTAVVMTIPIRIVSTVLRSEFNEPAFADDMLASVLIGSIQGSSISATSLNEKALSIQAGTVNTDSYQIWSQENQGITFNESVLLKFAYVAVDFTITINTDTSCLSSCQNPY